MKTIQELMDIGSAKAPGDKLDIPELGDAFPSGASIEKMFDAINRIARKNRQETCKSGKKIRIPN